MKIAVVSILALVLAGAPSSYGSDLVDGQRQERHERQVNRKIWWLSVAALTATTALDIQSSVGRYESNQLLRSGNGQLSVGRGLGIKMGIVGAAIGGQLLMSRKQEGMPKLMTFANFAGAGATSAMAIYNMRVPKAAPATPFAAVQ